MSADTGRLRALVEQFRCLSSKFQEVDVQVGGARMFTARGLSDAYTHAADELEDALLAVVERREQQENPQPSSSSPQGEREQAQNAKLLDKGLALLKSLAAPHEPGHPDHAWRKCRKCLAREDLDHKGADAALKAVIASAEAGGAVPGEQRWQEIETAPKDGTRILVFAGPHPLIRGGESRVSVAKWGSVNDSDDGWVRDNIGVFGEPVLFWMPLPPSPSQEQP